MHLQAGTPGWLTALLQMPDGVLLKAVNDPSILAEAGQTWVQAGRDPSKLFTCFRHSDTDRAPAGSTWEQAKAWWRGQFLRFVDQTYLERYAPFITLVEEANEYTASSTWQNAAETLTALRSMEAAVVVWNGEFRGQGSIRSDCRLVIGNGPVSNDLHVNYYKVAVDLDAVVGYHPYTRYFRGQRFEHDWRDDSGRWHFLEQAYGYCPDYAFTECGPYMNTENGWRHPDVLNANPVALVEAMWAWLREVQSTPAYRQGRVLGPGAWFTSGHIGWQYYQLETSQLSDLAAMLHQEGWKMPTINEQIIAHAEAIIRLAKENSVLYRARLPALRRVRDKNGAPLSPDVLLPAGEIVSVYSDPPRTIGGWTERVEINLNGDNLWAEGLERV